MKETIEGHVTTKYGTSVSSASHVNIRGSLQKPRGLSESLSTHESSYYSGSSATEVDENDYGDENDEAFEEQYSYGSSRPSSQYSGPLSVLETENQRPSKSKKSESWLSEIVPTSIFGREQKLSQRQHLQNYEQENYSTHELYRRHRSSTSMQESSQPRRKSVIVQQLEEEELDEAKQLSERIKAIRSQLYQPKTGERNNHQENAKETISPLKEQANLSKPSPKEEVNWDYDLKDHRTTSWNYFYPSGLADLLTPRLPETQRSPSPSTNKPKQSHASIASVSKSQQKKIAISTQEQRIQYNPVDNYAKEGELSFSDDSDEDSKSNYPNYDMGDDGDESLEAASTGRARSAREKSPFKTKLGVHFPTKQSASTPATVLSDQSMSRTSSYYYKDLARKETALKPISSTEIQPKGSILSAARKIITKRVSDRNLNVNEEEDEIEFKPENAPSYELGSRSFQSTISEIRQQLSNNNLGSERANESRSFYSGSTLTSRDTIDCTTSYASHLQEGPIKIYNQNSAADLKRDGVLHSRKSPRNLHLSFRSQSTSIPRTATNLSVPDPKPISHSYDKKHSTRSCPVERTKHSSIERHKVDTRRHNSQAEGQKDNLPLGTTDGQRIQSSKSKTSPKKKTLRPMAKSSLFGNVKEQSSYDCGIVSLEAQPVRFERTKIQKPKRPVLKSPETNGTNHQFNESNARYSKPTPKEGSKPLHPLIRIISAGNDKTAKNSIEQRNSSKNKVSQPNEEDEIIFDPKTIDCESSPTKTPEMRALESAREKKSLWNNPGLWDTMKEDDPDEDIALGYPPNLGKYLTDYEDQDQENTKNTTPLFGSSLFCAKSNRDVTEEIRARSSPVEASHTQTEIKSEQKLPPKTPSIDNANKAETLMGSFTCSAQISSKPVEPIVLDAANDRSESPTPEAGHDKVQKGEKTSYEDESLDSEMGPFQKSESGGSAQKFTFSGFTNSTVGSSMDGISLNSHEGKQNSRVMKAVSSFSAEDTPPLHSATTPKRSNSLPENQLGSMHSQGSKSHVSAPMFYCGNTETVVNSNEIPDEEESVDTGVSASPKEKNIDDNDENVQSSDSNDQILSDSVEPQSSWTPKIHELIAQATGIQAEIRKELQRGSISPNVSHAPLSLQSTSKANGSSKSDLHSPEAQYSRKVVFVPAKEMPPSPLYHPMTPEETAGKPIKSILSNKSDHSFDMSENGRDADAMLKTQNDNLQIRTNLYSHDSSTVYGPSPMKMVSTPQPEQKVATSESVECTAVEPEVDEIPECAERTDTTKIENNKSKTLLESKPKQRRLPKAIFARRKPWAKADSMKVPPDQRPTENKICHGQGNNENQDPPKRIQGRVRRLLDRFSSKKRNSKPQHKDHDDDARSKDKDFDSSSSPSSYQTSAAVGPLDSESVFCNLEPNNTPSSSKEKVLLERNSARIGVAECDPMLDEYSQNGNFDENQLSPQSRELFLAEERLAQQLAKDLELLTKIQKMKQDRKDHKATLRKSSSVFQATETIRKVQRLILQQQDELKNDASEYYNSFVSSDTNDEGDEVKTEMVEYDFVSGDDENEVQYPTDAQNEQSQHQSWGAHYDFCGLANQIHDENTTASV